MVFIPQIQNEWLCAARAIVTCMAKLNNMSTKAFKELVHKRNAYNMNPKSQKMRALVLHKQAGVPTNREVSLTDLAKFENILKVQIIVISGDMANEILYKGDNVRPRKIFLYLKDHHYHAIVNIKAFFVNRKLCLQCLTVYPEKGYHQCAFSCLTCTRDNCLYNDDGVTCPDCNMICRNAQCYMLHKETREYTNGQRKGENRPSLCETLFRCLKCSKVMNRLKRDIKTHKCGEWFCRCCQEFVIGDHLCFYKSKAPRHTSGRFVFYDFETCQNDIIRCEKGYKCKPLDDCQNCTANMLCSQCRTCINCKSTLCGLQKHVPNYVVAQTACDNCQDEPCSNISKCSRCGHRCSKCSTRNSDGFVKPPCTNSCGLREKIFKGPDTCKLFCQWLISPQHDKMVVIAHNAKAFDNHFILGYCVENGIFPDIVYTGSKIMSMTIKGGFQLRFIDSLNFLPMSLKKLPKALNLSQGLCKGAFPHFANTTENWNYTGCYFPPQFYGVDHMSSADRKDFMEWYDMHKHETFDFQQEILKYTRDDVNILREACLKFRKLIMSITTLEDSTVPGVDPFAHSTIASSAMQIIRQLLIHEIYDVLLIDGRAGQAILKRGIWYFEGQPIDKNMISQSKFVKSPIPQAPSRGYSKHIKDSHKASVWLQWVSHINRRTIQHSKNGGEFRIPGTRYHVDGYHEPTKTVYEFLGCYYHGHHCIEDRFKLRDPRTNTTLKTVYQRTMLRLDEIRQKGYNVVQMWECHFDRLMHSNKELSDFAKQCDTSTPLNIRDAFAGGRVEPFRLFHDVKEGEKVRYLDVTSLYPFITLTGRYPTCHPTIITDRSQMDYTLSSYYGIVKADVLPPRQLYIPVLPYRCCGKLKFPLCANCAETENDKPCNCPDSFRTLTGTWTTEELKAAIAQGYKIVQMHEVYHFPQTSTDADSWGNVFEEYVKMFMKVKQEASGYPAWVQTDADKDCYIRYYHEHQGILLEKDKIAYNAPLRLISKLYANSAWGKFVQRPNLAKTVYVKSPLELATIRNDPTKDIADFHIITQNFIAIEYKTSEDHMEDPTFQNEVIGVFTTSLARLHLLKILQKTDRQTLYCDTDSVMYIEKDGCETLTVGDLLGDLTDELPENTYIKTYLCSGPKSYCLGLNDGSFTMKIKGISLNHTNAQTIDFQTMKSIVLGEREHVELPKSNIISRVKHHGIIYNRPHSKKFRLVFNKRVIDRCTYDTTPYGF